MLQVAEGEVAPDFARAQQLARYLSLCRPIDVSDDLAMTILATLSDAEVKDAAAAYPDVFNAAFEALAIALCRWARERPAIPITQLIQVVPYLRRNLTEAFRSANLPVLAAAQEHYLDSKQGFRAATNVATHLEAWTMEAKRALLGRFVVQSLFEGEVVGLGKLLSAIVEVGSFFPYMQAPDEISEVLIGDDWCEVVDGDGIVSICDELEVLTPCMTETSVQHIMLLLGFVGEGRIARLEQLSNLLVMPLARRLLEISLVDAAYQAIHWGLLFYGYKLDSELKFEEWVRLYSADMCNAGRRLAAFSGEIRGAPAKLRSGPIKIAFFTRGGEVNDAAINHFLPIFRYLVDHHSDSLEISVHVLQEFSAGMELACAQAGVKVVFYSDQGSAPDLITPRLLSAKRRLAEDGVQVAIWIHAFDTVFPLFGLRVAPLQILFSQYLHPALDNLEIDEVLTWGSPVLSQQLFNGRRWNVIPSALTLPEDTVDPQVIADIRQSFGAPGRVIAGTMARTEKVAQPEFLSCVVALLKQHPELFFVWTGQWEHEDVIDTFRSEGVLAQTEFIGWVDVSVYSGVIDVLLDSFPLSNGITAIYAMRAGVPIVSMSTPLSYVGRDIVPALEDISSSSPDQIGLAAEIKASLTRDSGAPLPVVTTNSAYVDYASTLIADASLRKSVGEGWGDIYKTIYANEDLMRSAFCERLSDMLLRHKMIDEDTAEKLKVPQVDGE